MKTLYSVHVTMMQQWRCICGVQSTFAKPHCSNGVEHSAEEDAAALLSITNNILYQQAGKEVATATNGGDKDDQRNVWQTPRWQLDAAADSLLVWYRQIGEKIAARSLEKAQWVVCEGTWVDIYVYTYMVIFKHIKHTKYTILAVDAAAFNSADNEYLKWLAWDIARFLQFQVHYRDYDCMKKMW